MPAPRDLYAVNYFPVNNGGYQMWSSYDGPQYQADMALARSLGFNTLRVNLPAKNGYFDFSRPTDAQLVNLADFYNRSKSAGIALQLALFDHWGNYGLVAGSKAWAGAVLGALPDTNNIAVIEIQNETRYASTDAYRGRFDSGWPPGAAAPSKVGPTAVAWARVMTRHIRSVTAGIPVTASCSHGTADLAAYIAAASNTPEEPDWYDWHCYAGSSNLVHSALEAAVGAVGNPALLYIGETGLTSAPTGDQGAMQAQQVQSDYIQAVRWSCARLGLSEPSPWLLFDMNSSAQFPGGQAFGLFDTTGQAKISGRLYQMIPPGSAIPAVGLNGDMQGNQPDSNSNALPVRWLLYKGQSGRQPISSAIDTVNSYNGHPTVLLTGSAGTFGGDNPPALESRPCTWPVIFPGQSYTFTCALACGDGSSAAPSLQISWYDSCGRYISSNNGRSLDPARAFARFSLSGTAPRGAAYARLFVRVGYNSGNIWVGRVTWAYTRDQPT